MKKDLSKARASAFAKAILGTTKGLTKSDNPSIKSEYDLAVGKIIYHFGIAWYEEYAENDIILDISVDGDHVGTSFFNAESFEIDYDANDKRRKVSRDEVCRSCDLYIENQAEEARRKRTDWRYGTLFFNGDGRYDIDFDKGGTLGGLHNGACFDILVHGEYMPTRIESGSDGWYLIGISEDILRAGAKVRI